MIEPKEEKTVVLVKPDGVKRGLKRAVRNIVHASETIDEANHEIEFWFSPEEIHDYKRAEEDIMF